MKKELIKLGIALAVVLLIGGLVWYISHLQEQLSMERQSFYAERYANDQERFLDRQEIKDLYAINENLQKKLAIKPNQVTKWLRADIQYRDTGSIRYCTDTTEKLVYPDNLHFPFHTPCYDLDFYLRDGVASYGQRGNDTISCIVYQERKHKIWFIKWGWSADKAALYSSCRDTLYHVFDHVTNERIR